MTSYAEAQPTLREKKQRLKHWIVSAACRVLLICVVAMFGVLYVVEVSAISAKGYDIADLQKQIDALGREHERLTVEIAKNQSMASVVDRLPALGFVEAADVRYIETSAITVARR